MQKVVALHPEMADVIMAFAKRRLNEITSDVKEAEESIKLEGAPSSDSREGTNLAYEMNSMRNMNEEVQRVVDASGGGSEQKRKVSSSGAFISRVTSQPPRQGEMEKRFVQAQVGRPFRSPHHRERQFGHVEAEGGHRGR